MTVYLFHLEFKIISYAKLDVDWIARARSNKILPSDGDTRSMNLTKSFWSWREIAKEPETKSSDRVACHTTIESIAGSIMKLAVSKS